jgi:hypothetical protein
METPTRVRVDRHPLTGTTIRWDPPYPGATGTVKVIRPCGNFLGCPLTGQPADGSYVVPTSAFANDQASYSIAYCEAWSSGEVPLCSQAQRVLVLATGDRFTSITQGSLVSTGRRTRIEGDDPVTLTWESDFGSVWRIRSSSLGVDEEIASPAATSLTIDPGTTPWPDGVHDITLETCDGTPQAPDCFPSEEIQLVVGGPTFDVRAWNEPAATPGEPEFASFDAFETWGLAGTGGQLDVGVDSDGGIWGLGEFHTAFTSVVDDVTEAHEFPLDCHLDANGRCEPVKPFANPRPPGPWTSQSVGGEHVLVVDHDDDPVTPEQIFLSQGGDDGIQNHGRVARFDPAIEDIESTPGNESICMYNMPEDGTMPWGLAWDGSELWVTDAADSDVLWSFDPDAIECGNLFDYRPFSTPPFDPTGRPGWPEICSAPDESGCIRRHTLGNTHVNARNAHLVWDEATQTFWITEYRNTAVTRYDLSNPSEPIFERFPLPTQSLHEFALGSGPWQLRLDGEMLYVNEYGDSDIVRFDTSLLDEEDCTVLVAGTNPCMSEIHVPLGTEGMRIHSIEIHDGRLWFTLSQEFLGLDPDSGGVGYIDLAAWDTGEVGTIFGDMLGVIEPGRPQVQVSYRGIAVDPDTGAVILADQINKQYVRLNPA